MKSEFQCWLMKSEPEEYSIDDLQRDGHTPWTGVRNYQARNFMRDAMRVGDIVLFYHSNATPIGISGLGTICGDARPDPTQFDPKSDYYDPRATADTPRWFLRDVAFREKFKRLLSLADLRANNKLQDMLVLKKGQRLSVQPVTMEELREILRMVEH